MAVRRAVLAVSWRSASFSPAGIPIYPIKTLIPIAGVLLFLQGIAEIVRCCSASETGSGRRACHDVEETGNRASSHQQRGRDAHGSREASMTDPQIAIADDGAVHPRSSSSGFPIAFTLLALAVVLRLLRHGLSRSLNLIVDQHQRHHGATTCWWRSRCSCSWATSSSAPTSSTGCSTAIQLAARQRAGLAGGRGADHLRAVRDRHRHRRRRRHADGPAGACRRCCKAGYDTKLSAGVICAGGTLGHPDPALDHADRLSRPPPASRSCKLYAAAMLPGFLLAGLYLVYVIGRAVLNPNLAPKLPEQTARQVIAVLQVCAGRCSPRSCRWPC